MEPGHGRFGSPDACPGSESLGRCQKTLGLPQVQLGLPGTLWELTYHSRILGASAAFFFTTPHRSAPPAATNPPLTAVLTPCLALWAWGILAGYLSGYPPRRISPTRLGLPLNKLQSFPPSLQSPARGTFPGSCSIHISELFETQLLNNSLSRHLGGSVG